MSEYDLMKLFEKYDSEVVEGDFSPDELKAYLAEIQKARTEEPTPAVASSGSAAMLSEGGTAPSAGTAPSESGTAPSVGTAAPSAAKGANASAKSKAERAAAVRATERWKESYFEFYDDVKDKSLKKQDW